jgi:hypothetical protein
LRTDQPLGGDLLMRDPSANPGGGLAAERSEPGMLLVNLDQPDQYPIAAISDDGNIGSWRCLSLVTFRIG